MTRMWLEENYFAADNSDMLQIVNNLIEFKALIFKDLLNNFKPK